MTSISVLAMTSIVSFAPWGSNAVCTAHNRCVKPALVVLDRSLFVDISKGSLIMGLFLVLAHISDLMYLENELSPLVVMAAQRCIRLCMTALLRLSNGSCSIELDDLLYATYLCGACLENARTYLHHFVVDLLHGTYGLPYEDTHIAVHAYTAWYNQSQLILPALEEFGSINVAALMYDMQYALVS